MMKRIKILMVLLLFVFLFVPELGINAKESTLNELLAQAKANRDAYNKAKSEKALTEQERDSAIKQKSQTESEIKRIDSELEKLEKEIKVLQENIKVKDKEIKEIMEFVQVANGENSYMEYAFGASSFTDFIYRVSVAEQLSTYNEELIDSYNKDIDALEKKQKDLNNKQAELAKKQQELTVLEAKLNKTIEVLKEGMFSKDEEYKTQMALINSMKSRGCSGNDTPTSCQRKLTQGSNLVSTNGTFMPISSGYVTSDYGWRDLDGDGHKEDFHTGIDFSKSVAGDTVYPVADGEVLMLTYNARCGNHIVYVKHNIKGHSYITSYWHLSNWTVRVGQKVSANTKIGSMAGRNSGDTCSGGIHVHLNLFDNAGNRWENNVANGGNPNSGRINPRNAVPQIPGHMQHFSNR